jgi:hypothetical protein
MTTYIQMVNFGLREINETPLTSGQFDAARGVQAFAKRAVNRAYFDIANESVEWPWLVPGSITRKEGTKILQLTPGTMWYDIEDPELEVDWDTFYMTDKDPTVITEVPAEVSKTLTYCTYEQWHREFRDTDDRRTTADRSTPRRVIRHPHGRIGFSPVPDDSNPYYVEYLVWETGVAFSLSTDVLPFPEEFENTMEDRIRYYIWLFRENFEQASMARRDYKDSLASMKRITLSNKSERMRAV